MATPVQNQFDTQPAAPTPVGIVGGQINSTPTTAPAATAAAPFNPSSNLSQQTVTPQTREVNASTETTQGQLASILSSDSPLMQRARTLATQQMNGRGLVNSSMNAEAGTAAMIDRATPIANADANTYDARSRANMDSVNSGQQFNVNQNNAAVDRGVSVASQMVAQRDQQDFTAVQSQLDRDNSIALAQLQSNLNEASTSKSFSAATAQNTLAAINQIQVDGNLTPEAKRAAIENTIATANSTLAWASAFYNTPVPSIAAPGSAGATIQPGQAAPLPAASTPAAGGAEVQIGNATLPAGTTTVDKGKGWFDVLDASGVKIGVLRPGGASGIYQAL